MSVTIFLFKSAFFLKLHFTKFISQVAHLVECLPAPNRGINLTFGFILWCSYCKLSRLTIVSFPHGQAWDYLSLDF